MKKLSRIGQRQKIPVQRNVVVICTDTHSCTFGLNLALELRRIGLKTVVCDVPNFLDQNHYRLTVGRRVQLIRSIKTMAIVVCNADSEGVRGFLSPLLFAEVAISYAHSRPVLLTHHLPDTYRDELLAWLITSYDGDIRALKRTLASIRQLESVQLEFSL